MRRTMLVFVLLPLVLVPALNGLGMDVGARLSIQTPSLAIQAEWDVSANVSMGLFLETSLEPLFNPATTQTPSLTIGLLAKYRFTHIHPAFVPYLGLAGSYGLQGTTGAMAMDVLAGARFYIVPNVHLFAEVAFAIVPLPDVAAWYNPMSWYKTLYLGFGIRL